MGRPVRWSLVALLVGAWLWGLLPVGRLATEAGAAREGRGEIPYEEGFESIVVQADEGGTADAPRRVAERGTGAAEIRLQFYNDAPPRSTTVPPEVMAAARYAADSWEGYLSSPVPIVVQVVWTDIGRSLGNASIYEAANFAGAPLPDTSYPHALANMLAGRDLVPSLPEMVIRLNSTFTSWYFGTGAMPRDRYSLVGTVQHEIGHGLGFTGSGEVVNGTGQWGIRGASGTTPRIYDRFVVNGAGVSILDTTRFPNPSVELAKELQSGNLFWGGAKGSAADRGLRPRIYAPTPWNNSSYDHLDDVFHDDSLMSPFSKPGEKRSDPDPVTLGILADMGWTVREAGDPARACFPETGECMRGQFGDYWAANGGLAQQGLAISEPFVEISPTDGKPYLTQYFERARFEWHPENQAPYDVLLGLLGREQLQAKYGGNLPPPLPENPLGGECAAFEQTGKQVCGAFLDYWLAHGGLAQQGLPLTDLFLETNPTDGKQYPTQYFERARFEYHAEYAGTPFAVLLGLLGREQMIARYPGGVQPSPSPSPSPSPPPNPRLRVSPEAGPSGAVCVVVGSGFTPGVFYHLRVVSAEGDVPIPFSKPLISADAQGLIFERFTPDPAVPAGTYLAQIASAAEGGTVYASATFRLTGTGGVPAGPHLVVMPEEGSGAILFLAAGTGFAPNADYGVRVQSEDRERTIRQFDATTRADRNGVIAFRVSGMRGQPDGVYVVEVLTLGESPQVVAGATLRIVGP